MLSINGRQGKVIIYNITIIISQFYEFNKLFQRTRLLILDLVFLKLFFLK